jgi:S-(hydroxymethyl)glutathione dehydrogenase/alcohol dehydrogenase
MKYPRKFKAAILEKNNEPLLLRDVEFAGPLEFGQVMVQIHYSGICGKQIEEIQGTGGADPYLPHLLGHEGSGIVVDVGPGVTKVNPGDNVVLHWLKGEGIQAATPTYHRDGLVVNAGSITTFNEYSVVSENRVTAIPSGTDLKEVCLLGCCVATGIGVILNEALLSPGDSLAVVGCGGVGLSAIQGGRLAGADPIIAIDSNPASLDLALKLGANQAINPCSSNIESEISRITDGNGCGTVVIAVGNPNAIETGTRLSSLPGRVYVVGVPPLGASISVDPLDIHRGRTIMGSYGGGCVPGRDIPAYLELYNQGEINLQDMISQTVGLDRINDGIGMLLDGVAGRCVVKMM